MPQLLEMVGLGLIAAFLLLALVMRHQRFTTTRLWPVKALIVSAMAFLVSTETALAWGSLLGDFHLFDGASLGIAGGTLVGILTYEFAHYWYHRAVHRFPALWRLAHQMHHSPESLDAFGAFYMHPVDAVFFTTLSSLLVFPLLGLAPEAGALVALFLTFNALFQHANIKTPRWLGYLIQRPESHSLHHARGVQHPRNFSDLPLWDMVFGTFRNPAEFEPQQGLYQGASDRVMEMLVFQDVGTPPGHVELDEPAQPARTSPAEHRSPRSTKVEANAALV